MVQTMLKVRKNTWYVYIMECADTSLYTGITTDILRRVHEHNDTKKAAKYTRARQPVALVYSEKVLTRSEALIREAALKKYSRAQKMLLIQTP